MADAAAWFATPAGVALLRADHAVCRQLVRECFGQCGIELRLEGVGERLLEQSGIMARFQLVTADGQVLQRPARASLVDLPIGSNAVQLAIVHFVHQAMASPEPMFKEIERTLAPGGLVAIHGLNAIGRRLRWRRQPPDWVRCWPTTRTLHQNARFLGLEPVHRAPIFVDTHWVERVGRRVADWGGERLSGWLAAGYYLVYRKPDRNARIIDVRQLTRGTRAVPKTAPSAGMHPASRAAAGNGNDS